MKDRRQAPECGRQAAKRHEEDGKGSLKGAGELTAGGVVVMRLENKMVAADT